MRSLVLIVLTAILPVCAAAQDQPFGPCAQKVIDIPDAEQKGYYWLDSDRVLLLQLADSKGHYKALVQSIESGKTTALDSFNRQFSGRLIGMYNKGYVGEKLVKQNWTAPRAVLSPDRKWLLWNHVDWENDSSEYIAARLDGSKHFVWPDTGVFSGQWRADGNSWVGFGWGREKPSDQPKLVCLSERVLGGGIHPVREVGLDGRADGMALCAGLLPGERIVFSTIPEPTSDASKRRSQLRHATLSVTPIADKSPKTDIHSVKLPYDYAVVLDTAVIDHGRQLAWTVARVTPSQDAGLGIGIWASRVDGTDMHEICRYVGRMESEPDGRLRDKPESWSLKPTPDQKSVSFIFRNALYVAPIEPMPEPGVFATNRWLMPLVMGVAVVGVLLVAAFSLKHRKSPALTPEVEG